MRATTPYRTNKYLEKARHWDPESEPYASGHQLHSLLLDGWQIDSAVYRTEHHAGASYRSVAFYVIVLVRGSDRLNVPVMANPYVERVVMEANVKIVHVERSRKQRTYQKAANIQELALAN